MLTQAENEKLTRVGPGTPGGELMRRYWHPVYPEALLAENPVAKVRILGEDLVLYRDRSGNLGLIGQRCPHRADEPCRRHSRSRTACAAAITAGCSTAKAAASSSRSSRRTARSRSVTHRRLSGAGDRRAHLGLPRSAAGAAVAAMGFVREARRLPADRRAPIAVQLAAGDGEPRRSRPRRRICTDACSSTRSSGKGVSPTIPRRVTTRR